MSKRESFWPICERRATIPGKNLSVLAWLAGSRQPLDEWRNQILARGRFMRIDRWNVGRRMLLGASLLACSCLPAAAQTPTPPSAAVQTAQVPARIVGAVDESNRVKLRGNVHPLARGEFERGGVHAHRPLHHVL